MILNLDTEQKHAVWRIKIFKVQKDKIMWITTWRWEPRLFCSGQMRDQSWLLGNTFIYLLVSANGISAWMIFGGVDVCTAEDPLGAGLSRWWAYRDEDSDTRDSSIFGWICLESGNHCGYRDHNLSLLASQLAKYVRDSTRVIRYDALTLMTLGMRLKHQPSPSRIAYCIV